MVLVLALLAACAPAELQEEVQEQDMTLKEPKVETKEKVDSPPVVPKEPKPTPKAEEEKVPPGPTPSESQNQKFVPYTDLKCEEMLSAEQFAEACEQDVSNIIVTFNEGTRNCFVNVKDRENERLTAGITLTEYKKAEEASEEFSRRLKIFNVGASKEVGDRVYELAKVNRETLNFVRGTFIVEVGADERLCAKKNLLGLAKTVDGVITQMR